MSWIYKYSLAAVILGVALFPSDAAAQLEDLCPSPATECSILCASTLFQWADCPAEGGPPSWDEPLASDRPDFTEASTTVGRGVRQLEMGYTYFRDEVGNSSTTTQSFPEFLFRVGVLTDWLELHVGWTYLSQRENINQLTRTTNGAADLYLAVKFGLTPQNGILPEMALVPQMFVPAGHADFTAGQVLPGFNWLYGWDINDWLATGGSTQANLAIDDDTGDEFVLFAQSWTINYALTEKLGAYTEWFVLSPAGAETFRTEHYLDGGFFYRVTNNLQLDVRAGKGISGAAADYFVGTGALRAVVAEKTLTQTRSRREW